MTNLPNHIAVIPDGNRRWAKARGLQPWIGHEHGANALKKITKDIFGAGIKYFTFWASSEDNIKKRDPLEVAVLFKLVKKGFSDFKKDDYIHKNEIRVDFLGSWEKMFPEDLKEVLYKVKEETKNYTRYFLTFLMAYDGQVEMLEAVRKISKNNQETEITKDILKKNLFTSQLPPVDLVVRTGGEPHWSAGFMMWDVADSQLYFTETLWPDFNKKELDIALSNYTATERRLGA